MTVEAQNSAFTVVQWKLTKKENPPGDILTYGDTKLTTTGGVNTGVLEMAYDAAADEFDFTDFLTCNVDEIDLIAAQGNTSAIAYHYSERMGGMKLKRVDDCTCDDSSANNILNGFYLIFAVCIGIFI